MIELKPCPKCGGEVRIYDVSFCDADIFRFECQKCHYHVDLVAAFQSFEDTVKDWNDIAKHKSAQVSEKSV